MDTTGLSVSSVVATYLAFEHAPARASSYRLGIRRLGGIQAANVGRNNARIQGFLLTFSVEHRMHKMAIVGTIAAVDR